MRTHRPLCWITLFFSLGIILGHNVGEIPVWTNYVGASHEWPLHIWGYTALVFLLLGFLTIKKKWPSLIFILIAFIFLGMTHIKNAAILPQNHLAKIARYYRAKPVFCEGIVASNPQESAFFHGEKTSFILEVKRFKTKWGWRKKEGKILVNVFRPMSVTYGDYCRLEGKLHEPFGFSKEEAFSYKQYLNRKNIFLILSVKKDSKTVVLKSHQGHPLKAASLKVKNKLKDIYERNLTKNEAALMNAIILGDREQIPKHIKEIFIRTGTVHILAISGLHIGIAAFVIFIFIKLIPFARKIQYILTIVLLCCYVFLTGGRPSVIRAAIMAVVFIAGFIFERETDALNSLALAAALLLIYNPNYLFDVGFQLSFISVISIIYFHPMIMKISGLSKGPSRGFRPYLLQSMSVSFSVWLGVAGLMAYHFQILTPVTVVANLLVIPAVTVIIVLGFGMLLFSVIFPATAFIFAVCIKVILNIMVGGIYLFSQIPYAYIYLDKIHEKQLASYYFSVLVLVIFLNLGSRGFTGMKRRWAKY